MKEEFRGQSISARNHLSVWKEFVSELSVGDILSCDHDLTGNGWKLISAGPNASTGRRNIAIAAEGIHEKHCVSKILLIVEILEKSIVVIPSNRLELLDIFADSYSVWPKISRINS